VSEEFCDGVKILLKRMESNPEEFTGVDRWEEFTNHHQLKDGFWVNVLNPEEVEALRAGIRKIFRQEFTSRVMAKLLEDKEVVQGQFRITEVPPGTWVSSGSSGGGSGMLGQGIYHPAQNSITATNSTSYANIHNATSDTSFAAKLKQKLAKL
jgi:hypothetical protein